MALDNCINCPNNCLGNVLSSDCVVYNQRSLTSYIAELEKENTPPGSSEQALNTDSITSKSIIRNTSGACGSKIVTRNFSYTMTASQTGAVFGWSLTDVVRALPTGYRSSVIRVKVSGATVGSKNVIADSRKQAGGVSIKTNQFPISADILVRVTTPCGDVDMEGAVKITSPGKTGTFTGVLKVVDLNPNAGEIMLTDQLNSLEAQIYEVQTLLASFEDPSLAVAEQAGSIESLELQLADPSSLEVVYEQDTNKFTKQLGAVITALYKEIGLLKTTIASQEVEITNLRAQVDSINATS